MEKNEMPNADAKELSDSYRLKLIYDGNREDTCMDNAPSVKQLETWIIGHGRIKWSDCYIYHTQCKFNLMCQWSGEPGRPPVPREIK